jgi:DNA-directed RNA polymerase subunit RPC12/RpoP
MHGITMNQMSVSNERRYVSCARCSKNVGVTVTYLERKTAKYEPILCNDCRKQGEGTIS